MWITRIRGLFPLLLPMLLTFGIGALGSTMRSPSANVTAAGSVDGRSLVGFHALERNSTDRFRWSTPDAAAFLFGFDGREALVSLRMAAPRPEGGSGELTLHSGDKTVGTFTVAPQWRHYQLLVPTNPVDDTSLRLESTWFSTASDSRQLGVVLSELRARATNPWSFPSTDRLLFLGSFPLLCGLLAMRARVHQRIRIPASLIVALAAGVSTFFPTAAGYYLPTAGWPWWPLLPLAILTLWPQLGTICGRAAAWIRQCGTAGVWAGALLVVLAVVGLRAGVDPWFGLVLLVGAVALVVICQRAPVAVTPTPIGRREVGALLMLTLIGMALRLYKLDVLPLGLWRDEARHGLLALQIWNDPHFWPVYVVGGADLPALLFYLMAPVVGLLGPDAGAVRLVSALCGALTPLALWWASRPMFGARAAVFGAALLTWASWSLSMSRWAFPATLDQLLTLTAIGLLWRGLDLAAASRRRHALFFALAGMCGALSVYAYHTGRLTPLILAALVFVRLGVNMAAWRRALPGLIAAALVGLMLLAPLLLFIRENQEGYNRRVAVVALFNRQDTDRHAPLLMLLGNIEPHLLMWHVRGDDNGRHHAPGAPMLDPLVGGLFALGLGIAFIRRNAALRGVVVWLAIGLVPGILSVDAPHTMRLLGALDPACALAGVALALLLREAESISWSIGWKRLTVSGAFGASMVFNIWLYFGVMPTESRVFQSFDLPGSAAGRIIRAAQSYDNGGLGSVRVFVTNEMLQGSDVARFLTADRTPAYYDGRGFSEEPGAQALLLLALDATDEARAAVLQLLGPEGRELEPLRDPAGVPLLLVYGVGDEAERLVHSAWPP